MRHPILKGETYLKVNEIMKSGEMSGFRGYPAGHLGGRHVQALEEAFCEYFNVKYAVAMNSATSCLHAALIVSGVKQRYCTEFKDEVIVTPYSFSSSASCVLMVGGLPVFIDVDEETFCMNPTEPLPFCKAVIPVHLCGHPADMDNIASHFPMVRPTVIEDAAQSIGAEYDGRKVGTIGDCGIFSFNQSKHVSTGEGGLLITNDENIARVCRAIRNHGEVSDPDLMMVGYNFRMCEIEAAMALDQFKELDKMNDIRIELCNRVTEKLSDVEYLVPPVVKPNCKHVFYTYALKIKPPLNKQDFCKKLQDRGVFFGTYVEPLYRLPIYGKQEPLPVTERLWKDELIVSDIFRYPMTVEQCASIAEVIKEVVWESLSR